MASRRITLIGTTRVSQWFSPNFYNFNTLIKQWLEANGFYVIAVRTSDPYWFNTDYDINVEIEVDVFCEFSAEEARRNAIAALENAMGTATILGGQVRIFSNTTLRVQYDNGCTAAQGQPQVAVTNNPASTYDQTDRRNNSNKDGGGSWDAFWAGLGVTTPPTIATVAIIGLAYFLITKR